MWEQVGLALRADRRSRGQSQRAYAAAREISRDVLARAERDASAMRLDSIAQLLAGTGYELTILPVSETRQEAWWDLTDVQARTRAGTRFPAHREVRPSRWGPMWWEYHERLGNRGFGPKPNWSAEGYDRHAVHRDTDHGEGDEGQRRAESTRNRSPEGEPPGPRWPWH